MKKILGLTVIALLALGLLTACGDESGKKSLPVSEQPAAEEEAHYRDLMVPYDQVTAGDRIILLQTALYPTGRDGMFYVSADIPAAGELEYNGAAVPAFDMANACKFLHNELSGDVILHDGGETSVTVTAEEFQSLKLLSVDTAEGETYLDSFAQGDRVDLVTADGTPVLQDLRYAVFATGEGMVSVASNNEVPMTDILAWMGWDDQATYNLVATDAFYVPDALFEGQRGKLVGPLSGTTINGTIPDSSIAQGKIDDLIYIETITAE